LLVVLRDVVIVGGAIAYRVVVGPVEMAPTWLSKLNTGIEFTLLATLLATGAGLLDGEPWLPVLLWLAFATVLASGVQYVWIWGSKAAAARGGRRAM
jgi:cardiolipin synthase